MQKLMFIAFLAALGWVGMTGCSNEPSVDGKKASEWVNFLRHDDFALQQRAAENLVRLGAQAVPFLMNMVNNKDPALRQGVISTLGQIGPAAKSAVKALRNRIAREEIPLIRAEILKALSAIDPGDLEVKAEFTKRLRDQAVEVQEAARTAIEKNTPKPKPQEGDKSDAAQEAYQLEKDVAALMNEKMPKVEWGMVAEVARESRRVALVWPAIRDGKVASFDLLAWVFELQGKNSWKVLGEPVSIDKGQGPGKLAELLGGADKQRVIHACGVARDKLGSHIKQWACAFKAALAKGKNDEAMQAYQELAKAFSYSQVAFRDLLGGWLQTGTLCDTSWSIDPACVSSTCEVKEEGPKPTGIIKVVLQACGAGTVIAEMVAR